LDFLSEKTNALPVLAWLFVQPKLGEAKLLYGQGVDLFGNGFFEGCMAANLEADFTDIENVFGSGMKIQGNKKVFVTPSHTLEGLFLYRDKSSITVSNSLPFLIEYNDLDLPVDLGYGVKFASLCMGIDAYQKEVMSTPRGELMRIYYDNIIVGPENGFQLQRKPLKAKFTTYETYLQYLLGTLGAAFADATRTGRTAKYAPLATCSTGYDSSCVAALAKRLNCREAVTLTRARGEQADSGRRVAEILGYAVNEFTRPKCVEKSFSEGAEFLVTGLGGEDYYFIVFGRSLHRRVLLTGFHGDKIWEAHVEPNLVLQRGDASGSSLQEFRLRKDFIHIPVPMIGARRHPEVYQISRSSEMSAYRLNNDYDRPIPRRVLESSGVPRDMFGRKKRAASLAGGRLPLRGAAKREYLGLAMRKQVPKGRYVVQRLDWTARVWAHRILHLMPRGKRIERPLGRKMGLMDWRVFEHNHPEAALQFCAAIETIGGDYRRATEQFTRYDQTRHGDDFTV
jgi:hypothetical protein